jgi:hypothetical protein
MQSNISHRSLIQACLIKFSHELIGPLGSMQLAIEMDTKSDLIPTILEQTIAQLDVFRCVFNPNIKNEIAIRSLQKYIQQRGLNFVIENAQNEILPLLFFISKKMLKTSKATLKNNEIKMENIIFNQNEINALLGKVDEIDAENVLPYLSYLFYNEVYALIAEQLTNKNWIFKTEELNKK